MPLFAAGTLGPSMLAAGANVLGGIFNSRGVKQQNQANLQIARENRAWQERMSNTANQRAAADLEAAGLNRILAIGRPSSTPAGNVATMQNENAPTQQGIAEGSAKGIQAALAKQQLLNQRWQNAQTQSTIDLQNKQKAIAIWQERAAHSASRVAENEAVLSDRLKPLDTKIYSGTLGEALRRAQLLSTPANSARGLLGLLK